jgi:hypothetical protein
VRHRFDHRVDGIPALGGDAPRSHLGVVTSRRRSCVRRAVASRAGERQRWRLDERPRRELTPINSHISAMRSVREPAARRTGHAPDHAASLAASATRGRNRTNGRCS